jgi:hypothetical protein
MLDNNVIVPSHSPWASPIVVVRKKDNSIRLCMDNRKLNQVTVKDSYPLPSIDDSLDALRGNSWFSTLESSTRLCSSGVKLALHLSMVSLKTEISGCWVLKGNLLIIFRSGMVSYDFMIKNKCVINIPNHSVCLNDQTIGCILESQVPSLFRISLSQKVTIPAKEIC